jgi:hypothetical protein
MKKFGLLLLVACLIAASGIGGYYYGMNSSKLPSSYNESDGYFDFHPGVYIGGEDLAPGTYDVMIRGLKNGGQVLHYASREVYNDNGHFDLHNLGSNSTGYHFNIKDGEVVCFNFYEVGEMKIKKAKQIN